MLDPETKAREIASCWQPSIKDCECSMCILRPRIATALREYGEACVKEFAEGHRIYTSHEWAQNKEREFKIRADADAEGYRRGIQDAASKMWDAYNSGMNPIECRETIFALAETKK